MKTLYFILIAVLLVGCSESNDNNAVSIDKQVYDLAPFTVPIEGLDNLVVKDSTSVSASSASLATYDGGNLFTNKDGEIVEVEIPVDYRVKKVYDIEGSGNIAISFYIDASDDTAVATCVLDNVGLCNLEMYEPRKLSNLGNAPYYKQVGENLYYLKQNSLIQESSLQVNSMTLSEIPDTVAQISINNNGYMMIDTGSQIKMSASFEMVVPDTIIDSTFGHVDDLYPNQNRFFLPHKSGFLLKGGTYNDFYRVVDNSGVLESRMAQENEYYDVSVLGIGSFNRITLGADLSGCTYHVVGDDDLMVCGSKVYDLGDSLTDIKLIDFVWAGHQAVQDLSSVRILSDNNYLYYFSDSDIGNGKLTRIDLVNNLFLHIFSSPDATYKILTNSISNDVYRACTDDSVLEISSISTAPTIINTVGECSQIVSF